ncbi:putative ribonuclease H-like domain-containing protein [Tanacetum coccineum]
MVAQGYIQEEGIDYDKVFALVAKIEAITLFLAYASFMGFIVYQMDVKSAFLYDTIEEDVYVCQPPGFEDPQFPDKVYKVEKALYGLHQAPRAWYKTLSTYLLENRFRKRVIDKTLFIKKSKVNGKTVVILESSVRSDLYFNDEDGITCKSNDEIFVNLALIGKLDSTSKKFLMYPRFLQLFLNNQIALPEPFNDIYVTPVHTKKVFTNMKRQSKDFSRRIIPLFASMLVPQVVEGEGSGQPSKPQPPSSTAPSSQVTTVATQHQKTHKLRRAKRGEDDRVVRAATTASSLEAEQEKGNTSGSGEDNMEHQVDLTDFVPPTPHDSSLSGGHTPRSDEGRNYINELIAICTNLLNKVLALEQSKTAQDLVIIKMQKNVKRLEKALRARTLGMKLFKIGTSKRKGLDKENVSKQGRKSDKTKPMFNDSDFDVLDDAMENVEGGSTAEQISTTMDTLNTASITVCTTGPSNVSVAGPSISTAGDIFKDEMTTITDTLVAIRSARPRTTSVMIRNVEEEPRRATPVPTVQIQDKMDKELAQRLFEEEQAQFEKEQRIAREKAAETRG